MSAAGDDHEHVDSDYDEDLAIPDESLETKTDGEITVKLEDKVDFEAGKTRFEDPTSRDKGFLIPYLFQL